MSVFLAIIAALLVLDSLRLRVRTKGLVVLARSGDAVDPEHLFLVAPGVTLKDDVKRAASAHAKREGLAVLDLVPPDLPSLDALSLVQLADPQVYRRARIAVGRTAGHATLVTRDVLARARVSDEAPVDAVAFARAAVRLKRYACITTDLAVAPGLSAVAIPIEHRRPLLRDVLGAATPVVLAVQLALLTLLLAGPWLALVSGSLALAAFQLQPALALAGTPLSPPDLFVNALFRAPIELFRWMQIVTTRKRPEASAPVEAERPVYAALLAPGTDRFFEERRTSCPICEGEAIEPVCSMPDHFQHKPGRFSLDRCRACRHVFQNPRLSLEGLAFYYRDFYDGLGEEQLEMIFGFSDASYVARASALRGHAVPERWLDVGAGHGHFCCVARDEWPKTRFDGLDFGDSIEDAERRGWVDKAYRGLFPEIAPTLGEPYDVVSMSHYLEHTRDPRAELHAAALALGPSGHLLIEVPDPESALGRILGSLWMPWLQPQHQHFVPIARLEEMLADEGFTIVAKNRSDVHLGVDFFFAVTTLIDRVAPPLHLPWRPRASALATFWRAFICTIGAPFALIARILDGALAPLFRRPGWANAYRVLARRVEPEVSSNEASEAE